MSAKGRRGTQATSSLLMMSTDGAKGSTFFFGGDSERSSYCAYARMIVNGMMRPGFFGERS
jgi:hypothetical protein